MQHLADLGVEIDEFKIPDDALTQRIQSTGPTGIRRMTKDRFVDIPYFRAKLDAVQSYVDMLLKAPPRDLGFPRA